MMDFRVCTDIKTEASFWLAANPVFLDTETTGLGSLDQVVEIALLDIQGQILYQSLIRPTVPMEEEAAGVHGITDEELLQAPYWTDIYQDVRAVIDDRLIIGHFVEFDRRMLLQTCAAYDLPPPEVHSWRCTMAYPAAFHGKKHFSLIKTMAWLGVVKPDAGIAHRAVYDAECCRRVVLAMAA